LGIEPLERRELLAVSEPSGILWDPSPNFNGRGGTPIDSIVIHTMEGSFSGGVSWMKNPASEVSAHFAISPSGEIRQLVALSNRAWHATYYNSRSIGIEMAGFAGDPATWNATNLARLEHLTAWLSQEYGVPPIRPGGTAYDYPNDTYDAPGIVAHAQIQPWNRSDPGPHFPWSSFIQHVQSMLNAPPTAGANSYATGEDAPLAMAPPGVLGNDTDPDGDSLSAVLEVGPVHGTLALGANGSFTYTPAADYFGPDSFRYRANDGLASSNVATVSLTITPVNDAPRTRVDRYVVDEDGVLSVAASVASETMIAAGATWKYLDNGSDQRTAWRSPGFNDASWASGAAQLGYGEADEATVVGYGGDAGDKHVSTYFRHAFDLYDAGRVQSLTLRLKRDDGAAVYLNGTEIARDGLPAGADFDTPATNAADDGQSWLTFPVDARLLIDGSNVVAVEMHQTTPGSTDLSFDLELMGVRNDGVLGGDVDVDSASFGATLVRQATYGTVTLDADGSFTYAPNANFFGTDTFGYQASDGSATSGVTSVIVEVLLRHDAAQALDDDYEMQQGGSLAVDAVVENWFDLIPRGATWSYFDGGADLGTAWRAAAYDDRSWARGPGELGYGDGDETTVVGFGPDANNKHVTTYFRRRFSVVDASSIVAMELQLVRDDGAAVFLNGVEIVRTPNLAPGAAFNVLANLGGAAAIGGAEESMWLTYPIDPALLVEGENVLAVEMHQHAANSSDLSFHLGLAAQRRRTGVLADDAISDHVAARAVLVGPAPPGSFSLEPSGAFAYVPPASFSGEATFAYVVEELQVPLVAARSKWKYLDNGTNQGTAWRDAAYIDAAWMEGVGQFGYGDGDESTLVAHGGNPATKRITTYFRKTLAVTDPSKLSDVTLRLQRDDGAAVFLNGTEVARANLAAGADFDDTATNADDDGQAWQTFSVPADLLVPGENLLAVEVHQSGGMSSDLSFDLALLATLRSSPATVTVRVESTDPRGDLDGDGRVNAADIDLLYAAIGAGSGESRFDLDASGGVELADVDVLVRDLVETTIGHGTDYGDANLDGQVNRLDLAVLSRNYGKASGAGWSSGDFNGDRRVSLADAGVVQRHYQSTTASPAATRLTARRMSLLRRVLPRLGFE
jgi:hypothetical protein